MGVIKLSVRSSSKVIKLEKEFCASDTIATVKQALIDEELRGSEMSKIKLIKGGRTLLNNKRLQYYKITKSTVITLIFKVIGGMAQQLNDDEKYQNEFNKHKNKKYDATRKLDLDDPDIKLAKKACSTCYVNDSDIQRAQMECGCRICPDCMLSCIKSLYSKNRKDSAVVCAFHNKEWDFQLCLKVAVMDEDDEMYYDEQYEIRTTPESKECPGCGELCERPEDLKKFRVRCVNCSAQDWCWLCGEYWNSSSTFSYCGNKSCACAEINETLQGCDDKDTTYHVDNDDSKPFVRVPTIRGCISCYCFIEHDDKCKHMECPECKQEFCFACLKAKNSDGSWPCGAHYNECPIAPRQQLK